MEYVSPFDERTRGSDPLAPRSGDLAGKRVALLDITKPRGDEFLDRVDALLRERGATTFRARKEIFSKPAAAAVIEEVGAADLVVEGLAD